MSDNWGRMFGGFAALAVVWIGVYWWWDPVHPPSEPPITFDETGATPTDAGLRSSLPPLAAATTESPARATTPGPAVVENTVVIAEPEPAEPAPPPPEPAPRRAVIPPQFKDYIIREGDTFERIAEREFGSSRHARAISQANPFVDPTRLRIGRKIRLPLDPTNIQGKPVEGEPREPASEPQGGEIEYTVRSGDTLSRIAKIYLGSEAKAEEIYRANRDRLRSPDDLKIGQKLRIPAPSGAGERR